MTEQEKNCYNTYLATSRTVQNKPFKIRKDFKGFEEKEEYLYIKRICKIFNQFPEVDHGLFFRAPYNVYPDRSYFDLKFFSSQKAIRAYTVFLKKRRNSNIDSEDMLTFIKDSLKYIGKYCYENNLRLKDYVNHKEGLTYCWFQHLMEHKICIYPLFRYKQFVSCIENLGETEKELMSDIHLNLDRYRSRYMHSKKAKTIIQEGYKKIEKLLS